MTEEPEIDPALAYFRRRVRVGERVNLVLRAYVFIGFAFMLGGLGYVLYSKLEIDLNSAESVALASSFAGGLMAGVSFAYMSLRKEALERDLLRYQEHLAVGRFIEAWVAFEEAAMVAAFGEGIQSNRFNIRMALRRLADDQKLSITDQMSAEHLLQVRNSIVHGAQIISQEDLQNALEQLVRLISKLS